jgi:aldehyde:ferredoxin oxidoreductase
MAAALVGGFAGRLVRIDLTSGSVRAEPLPRDLLPKFLGAKGLGAYYLARELPGGTDPLGEGNKIAFATGPYQGSTVTSAGRFAVVSKSPLTGIFIDSYCGGDFGHVLKWAGYDMAIIEGAASTPSYVAIDQDGGEVKDARDLWGKTTWETERALLRTEDGRGTRTEVLSIGPAGENLVRFASPITRFRRAAGRGGTGAVMGSKKLKAVVVRGGLEFQASRADGYKKGVREGIKSINDSRKEGDDFLVYGTSQAPEYASKNDRLPTRNYRSAQFELALEIAGPRMHETFGMKGRGCCAPCVIACEGYIAGKERGAEMGDRPEYETIAMLGSNAGIGKPESIMRSNDLCNALGLDTISTGGVVGFAMDCAERGILDLGFEAKFGDEEAPHRIIEMIVKNEGAGKLLAEGTRRAAELIGGGAERLAVHGKGLEIPAWDPRGKLGHAIAYATADVGASHMRDSYRTKKVPDVSALEVVGDIVKGQNKMVWRDSFILCAFAWDYVTETNARRLYNDITGFDLSEERFFEASERIWTLIRAFNCREGVSRAEDTLSHRMMCDPLPTGPAQGCTSFVSEEDHQECLNRYYELRGWDEDGVPTSGTLKSLGLAGVAA